jgi:xanthine dehydrogenase YagR molybdenum-binding subunit
VKIESEYRIPIEHHNPMEPHGAIAFWEGDKLTIFDKTQGVYTVREHLASSFGVPPENVSVVSPFVGGAFGSSLRPNYYPGLTAMAARELKRPVKVVYTRTQMYTGHGYRPYTIQKIRARRGAGRQTFGHDPRRRCTTPRRPTSSTTTRPTSRARSTPARTSRFDQDHRQPILSTPVWMRAPGAVSGMFALECAMDERPTS